MTELIDPTDTRSRIKLAGKDVLPSEPHTHFKDQPDGVQAPPIVGRGDELELITAAWMAGADGIPLAPLLVGEPGVGKNRIVYEMAKHTGKNLYIFQGHEDVTAEDLACMVRFSDEQTNHVSMDYMASPLVTAMHQGDICFIDEIAKIRPRALALLVSVLDERRCIDSTLLGGRIQADPGFRFVAATNTADLEGNALPEFLRSRMRPVIPIGYPTPKEIKEIVTSSLNRVHADADNLLPQFWELWNQLHTEHKADQDPMPSPREVLQVFKLALSHADCEAEPVITTEGTVNLQGGAAQFISDKHLEIAFREMFMSNTEQTL